jgi:hypothetical protein
MKTLLTITAAVVAIALAAVVSPTGAMHSPEHYSLFDNASYTTPGHDSDRAVLVVSDTAEDPAWGGIDYGIEDGTTFADLMYLGTWYMFPADDSCGGGSPRFQIAIDEDGDGDADGNIFVYLGPSPNYTGCAPGVWTDSGDLLETGKTVDSSQLTGGTFYDPYDAALARYGENEVLEVQIVADAGWAFGDGEQSVDVDDTMINTTLFTYEVPPEDTEEECTDGVDNDGDGMVDRDDPDCAAFVPTSKDQCKKGGWEALGFRNQGQCVSYFNRNN